MKSLLAYGNDRVEIIESQNLTISADELLIAPIMTGVCGTDLEIIGSKIDPAFVHYPIVIGHEWCGRLLEVGSDVTGFSQGDRVVAEGIIPCGECFECVGGNTNRCTTYDEIGFTRSGAAAQQIVVKAHLVHLIHDNVSHESAALVEPTAVVTQGILKVAPRIGAKVLIIGDGTIALIAAKLIHNWSPDLVHMLGLKAGQEELAKEAGVDLFMTTSPVEKYDLVIEASGSSLRISESIRFLVRGGTLLLLGFTGSDIATPIFIDDVVNGDLSLISSFGYSRSSWKATVDLLNSGNLDLTFLVTHRFSLSDFATAIESLRSAPAPRGKIAFVIGN